MTVRPAVASDEAGIRNFLSEFYGCRSRLKYPERWRWQFAENPFAPPACLPVLLAFESGRVVGQLGLQYAPLWIGKRMVNSAWGVDFAVLPDFQGRGLGRALQLAASNSADVLCSALMDARAARIKRDLGFVAGAPLRLFSRFDHVSSADVLGYLTRKVASRRALTRFQSLLRSCAALAWAAAAVLRWKSAALPAIEERGLNLSVAEVSSFDSEADLLWDRLKDRFMMTTARTSQYLNWRYSAVPNLNYRKFMARAGNSAVGLAVLRELRAPELSCLRIVDLFGEESVLAFLLSRGIAALGDRPPWIEMLTSCPSHARALRTLGFVPLKQFVPMASGSPNPDLPLCDSARQWLITAGDQDCDQFRPTAELLCETRLSQSFRETCGPSLPR